MKDVMSGAEEEEEDEDEEVEVEAVAPPPVALAASSVVCMMTISDYVSSVDVRGQTEIGGMRQCSVVQ